MTDGDHCRLWHLERTWLSFPFQVQGRGLFTKQESRKAHSSLATALSKFESAYYSLKEKKQTFHEAAPGPTGGAQERAFKQSLAVSERSSVRSIGREKAGRASEAVWVNEAAGDGRQP